MKTNQKIKRAGTVLGLFSGLLLICSLAWAGKTLKIMPLGDSLTEGGYNLNGVYYSNGGGYRLPLEEALLPLNPHIEFVGSLENGPAWMPQRHHEGHSGWRIEQLSSKVDGWLTQYKPDIILLLIGSNNMWKAPNRKHADKLFANLVDKIEATLPHTEIMAASIIYSSNPEVNFHIARYNHAIRRVIKNRRKRGWPILWVDMNKLSGIKASDLTDGAHPTAEGYAKMARVWFEFLAPQVANPQTAVPTR